MGAFLRSGKRGIIVASGPFSPASNGRGPGANATMLPRASNDTGGACGSSRPSPSPSASPGRSIPSTTPTRGPTSTPVATRRPFIFGPATSPPRRRRGSRCADGGAASPGGSSRGTGRGSTSASRSAGTASRARTSSPLRARPRPTLARSAVTTEATPTPASTTSTPRSGRSGPSAVACPGTCRASAPTLISTPRRARAYGAGPRPCTVIGSCPGGPRGTTRRRGASGGARWRRGKGLPPPRPPRPTP